jgi:hypothetical protein
MGPSSPKCFQEKMKKIETNQFEKNEKKKKMKATGPGSAEGNPQTSLTFE